MLTRAIGSISNESSLALGSLSICLVFVLSLVGCAPKQVGPTAPSGYYFVVYPPPSVDVRNREDINVRVQDAQGQGVDGVSVIFQVAPSWADAASVVPEQTITQAGQAQASFRSAVTGPVPVRVQVENAAHELTIIVGTRPSHGSAM